MQTHEGAPSAKDFESSEPFWAAVAGEWRLASVLPTINKDWATLGRTAPHHRIQTVPLSEVKGWARCEPPIVSAK